jgi:CDP-glycerol glycerophosphotransferase
MSEKILNKLIAWLKNIYFRVQNIFIDLLLGWGFAVGLSYIIPKKKNLIVFIENPHSGFRDNLKYLFIYIYGLKESGLEIYFLTESKKVFNELKNERLPVILYPRIISIFKLLRADMVVVDTRLWVKNLKCHFSFKSRKIQLWHGVGFKKMPMDDDMLNADSFTRKILNTICCIRLKYDLFVSTSEFYSKNVFSKAFRFKEISEGGYPRNDCFFIKPNNLVLLGVDKECLEIMKRDKDAGFKIVFYAPTFRNSSRDLSRDIPINISRLSKFVKEFKILFVFKFHRLNGCDHKFNYLAENIIDCDSTSDPYPLFPLIDLIITDYSSIYMDTLLLDKPVIFFPYDYQKYISECEEIYPDFNWITPGPKCYTYEDLEKEIKKHLVEGIDEYKEIRKEILNMAFKYKDGRSSERIWNFIKNRLLG